MDKKLLIKSIVNLLNTVTDRQILLNIYNYITAISKKGG